MSMQALVVRAGAALVAALASAPVGAAVSTSGCVGATSCTLAELFGGASITVNSKIFSGFELESIDADGVSPDFTQIVVEGRDDGGLSPGNGIRFNGNGEIRVTGADRLDMAIGFVVEEVGAGVDLTGNSLDVLSDTVGGTGFYTLGEFVADGAGVGIGQKEVENDPSFAPAIASDAIGFPVAKTMLIVEKDLLLVGSAPADVAEIDVFEQRFSQLPEPGSAASLLPGAAALLLLDRRRRRRARRASRTPEDARRATP